VIDLRQLRAAIHHHKGAEVVALVRARLPLDDGEPLQMIGDGLVAALIDHVDGAAEAGAAVVASLRDRGWVGDDELADQLESRLGAVPTPTLRPLTIDLEDLAAVLEGDPTEGGGRIDLRTGEVLHEFTFEYLVEIGEEPDDEDQDPDRWLQVWREGSSGGYGDMEYFIETLSDPHLAERLRDAIRGPGLPPVRGRPLPCPRGVHPVARLRRRAPAWQGPGLARRRGLLRGSQIRRLTSRPRRAPLR
jgi:hypothetical protein